MKHQQVEDIANLYKSIYEEVPKEMVSLTEEEIQEGGAFRTGKTVRDALRETKDSFDIVKGHLIDEGYADTEEAALAIMANMGEAWKQSILDEAANRDEPLWGPGSKTPSGKPSPTRKPPMRDEPLW